MTSFMPETLLIEDPGPHSHFKSVNYRRLTEPRNLLCPSLTEMYLVVLQDLLHLWKPSSWDASLVRFTWSLIWSKWCSQLSSVFAIWCLKPSSQLRPCGSKWKHGRPMQSFMQDSSICFGVCSDDVQWWSRHHQIRLEMANFSCCCHWSIGGWWMKCFFPIIGCMSW